MIKTYSAEYSIAEQIQKNNSIALEIPVYPIRSKANLLEKLAKNVVATNKEDEEALKKILQVGTAAELEDDIDIYRTKSILVSTVWNKNDDIFGPEATWAARRTPVHKYTNIGHEHKQIVGCITDTWCIDNEGNLIAEDIDVEDLPKKFHICNSAVIWRCYRDEDLVAQAETLIKDIEDGKKFVSMECLFSDFDYGVISPENKYFTIARNEETAFLTKHLRIYGGTGSYEGYKIGRFIKKMVFSGKGYVDKPANPESVIFNDETEINFSESSVKDKWFDKKSENFIMANENTNEVETLKSQVAELTKKLADANVKAFEEDLKELRDEVAQSNESNLALTNENKTLKAKAVEIEASVKPLNDKIEELTKANEDLNKKVSEAQAEKIKSDRINVLIAGGIDKTVAVEKVEKYASLSDEQFIDIANTLIEAQKMCDEKSKGKKEEKKEEAMSEVSEDADAKVLDTAKPNVEDAVGSVDGGAEESETDKTRKSLVATLSGMLS